MSSAENGVHTPSVVSVMYIWSASFPTGVCMGSGKKWAKANVSDASPLMTDPSPVAAEDSEGLIR